MTATALKVMVVEDERIVAFNLRERLTKLGYDVSALATSGSEALTKARATHPDLVLMDIRIEGDIDGIETARQLGLEVSTPVIYLTAHSEDNTIERARATRPYGYLLKPFSERELHATIQMALERHATDVQLQVSEDRLRLALDAAEMGAWDIGPDSDAVNLAGRTAGMLGLGADLTAARLEDLLDFVDPADRGKVRARLQFNLEEIRHCEVDFRLANHGDTPQWRRVHAKTLPMGARRGKRTYGVMQDVTREHLVETRLRELNADLERRVAERTSLLAATNEALTSFNHSIAHDLRAPVRAIEGFSAVLLDAIENTIEPDHRRYLQRIHDNATHLHGMIEGLLTLSMSTSAPLVRREINLSLMVHGIARQLHEAEPQRVVLFQIAPDISAHADLHLIEDVLHNLLSNAWMYTSKTADACIEFGERSEKGKRFIYVKDNGDGFDMQYARDLFQPFKRLHNSDEFPGTGIGLSSVKRIVERHGGEVRFEAAPGKGATFLFTLP